VVPSRHGYTRIDDGDYAAERFPLVVEDFGRSFDGGFRGVPAPGTSRAVYASSDGGVPDEVARALVAACRTGRIRATIVTLVRPRGLLTESAGLGARNRAESGAGHPARGAEVQAREPPCRRRPLRR
jgi:hypothetical protein